jgi:hypothetical protein
MLLEFVCLRGSWVYVCVVVGYSKRNHKASLNGSFMALNSTSIMHVLTL